MYGLWEDKGANPFQTISANNSTNTIKQPYRKEKKLWQEYQW